jgi:hypothetical protein
MIKLLSNEE